MVRDDRGYLWDMRDAADAILRFTAGMESAGFAESELVRSEVELKAVELRSPGAMN